MTKPVLQPDLDQLRQELASERRARTELEDRLRRTRADFQEFVARISHDLREPLRTVNVYAQLISSKAAADEESALYLDYIHDAVERAQALLAAMVEYAALEREPLHACLVDMNAVYQETLRRINAAPPVSITSEALPAVTGDFELLTKVLRHIIDNAIKFAGRPDAAVHVCARRDGDERIISVCDNGPGIDPAHRDKIFCMFHRLHGREIPGSGLGLAFSKNAVELLGGRIWVESEPGQGSVFCLALRPAD